MEPLNNIFIFPSLFTLSLATLPTSWIDDTKYHMERVEIIIYHTIVHHHSLLTAHSSVLI